jgi:hypothetical protein
MFANRASKAGVLLARAAKRWPGIPGFQKHLLGPADSLRPRQCETSLASGPATERDRSRGFPAHARPR